MQKKEIEKILDTTDLIQKDFSSIYDVAGKEIKRTCNAICLENRHCVVYLLP